MLLRDEKTRFSLKRESLNSHKRFLPPFVLLVMKALEKDRARRYPTANGVAMDIQRYLADEQVRRAVAGDQVAEGRTDHVLIRGHNVGALGRGTCVTVGSLVCSKYQNTLFRALH